VRFPLLRIKINFSASITNMHDTDVFLY
jgi:hypothetical protein